MAQDIYIIENNQESIDMIKKIFENEILDFKFSNIHTKNLNKALKSIPTLIIIDEDNIDKDIIDVCKIIRADEDNNITPIIVMSNNNDDTHISEVLAQNVEYYIKKPADKMHLYYTIKNLIRLIDTNRTVSPLTGLPGNVQIHAELKKRLLAREEFAVLYLDLDNFKAYNDLYGFLAGDEIIKFTANVIVKNVHGFDFQSNFVGHIGGDDFIAIVEGVTYEEVCKRIIAEFEIGVKKFFNEDDLDRGYIEVPNRKCVMEQYPLTAISIGVVVVDPLYYANILEIGEVGAQVKHVAKTTPGNTYAVNRRKPGLNDKNACEIE